MPKIILRCNYLSGVPAAQVENYVRYIATRDRTEKVDNAKALLPASAKQKKLIEDILRDIPGAKGMHEYADYILNPTRRNASELITQALEQNLDMIATRENYVDYISNRPGVQQIGEHGLFTDAGAPVVLSRVQGGAANHTGPVWTHVISLRREDAARLGYDHAEQWMALLRSQRAALAKEMKIDSANLRWYAAFHDESHHPHVHLMIYSANPKQGFLTEQGIQNLRSTFAHDIFRQDFAHIYDEQNLQRAALKEAAAAALRVVIERMRTGVCLNRQIHDDLRLLAEQLPQVRGKKVYGFIPKELKAVVDRVVDELAREKQVAPAYAEWHRLSCEILKAYRDNMPEAPPLSQQKQFKSLKNIVIAEAIALGAFQSETEGKPEPDADQAEPPMIDDDDMDEELPPDGADQSPEAPAPHADEVDTSPTGADDPGSGYKIDWSDKYKLAREYLYGSEKIEQDFSMAYRLFMAEATGGNALAMCDLGRMHKDGVGREINTEAAHAWYAKALAAFLAVEDKNPKPYPEYRIGKLYAAGDGTEQNYSKAASWFGLAAESNHKYAQYSLAGLYYRGQGVVQDYGQALELYRRSAAQHNPYASYELAKMLRDGIGAPKNPSEAALHFGEAFTGFVALEEKGRDDKLQYRIGQMLYTGAGTNKDPDAAIVYFEKAAKLGNVHAGFALAKAILKTDGYGERISEAVAWMARAAESGNQFAQYSLGKLYLTGEHLEKDIAKAVDLLTQSAGQENQYAQYTLGKLYLAGEDVPKDTGAAIRCLTASAEQGNQFAQYTLGKLYLVGKNTPKDIGAAIRWLTASVEQGNQFAQYTLGKLYLVGEDVPKDIDAAIRWLTASAEQGNQFAQYALGKLYIMGRDIPRDRDQAERWFTLAAAQGNEYAQFFLDHLDEIGLRSPVTAATNLLRALARLFEDQADELMAYRAQSERKTLSRERRKKIAQGHAADDQEPKQIP